MADGQAVRVLVASGVAGRFSQLFQRVESVSKAAGPFDLLLCVGEFFAADEKVNDELRAYVSGEKRGAR